MISVPILAGALMRFPLGCSQYIGRKNAALVEMGLLVAALAFGYFFIDTYDHVLAMGVLLGIAGASFGVALSLGSGWFPPRYKGLAMGIAGAGNSGTVLAVLFAPPLANVRLAGGLRHRRALHAAADGRHGFAAKEPPDVSTRPSGNTSPACSRRTAGPSASSTSSPSAASSASRASCRPTSTTSSA